MGNLDEDVAAMVVVATIVVMVAVLVRLSHRCRSALVSKSA